MGDEISAKSEREEQMRLKLPENASKTRLEVQWDFVNALIRMLEYYLPRRDKFEEVLARLQYEAQKYREMVGIEP